MHGKSNVLILNCWFI